MTFDPITAGEHAASELMHVRLSDRSFAGRLDQRLRAWEVDRPTFLAQVEDVVLVALLATAGKPDVPKAWYVAAAAALQKQEDLELFAALPVLPDGIRQRVTRLRLLSIGITPRSGHRWLRLSSTASEFLQPAARLDPPEV
ncbi:hypothetical protein [Streptomyces sp. NPDC002133]|uniref:hypothetical protein n=1 Tax=Streptomyces sp. NPDC002133 TaxID=3154409 RepID=UPI003318BA1D